MSKGVVESSSVERELLRLVSPLELDMEIQDLAFPLLGFRLALVQYFFYYVPIP